VLLGPDGHGGEVVLEEQPTSWDRNDPDVLRTLDWLNGWGHHDPPEVLQQRVHLL
jgi:hypothetical protein